MRGGLPGMILQVVVVRFGDKLGMQVIGWGTIGRGVRLGI